MDHLQQDGATQHHFEPLILYQLWDQDKGFRYLTLMDLNGSFRIYLQPLEWSLVPFKPTIDCSQNQIRYPVFLMQINMKLTFTWFCLFVFLICLFLLFKTCHRKVKVRISQPGYSKNNPKKASSNGRKIGENNAIVVDSYACSMWSPKNLFNCSRHLITPTLLTEPGSLCTRW